MFEKTRERYEKLKEKKQTVQKVDAHVRSNQDRYKMGAAFVAGGVVARRFRSADLKQTIGSFNINYKSTTTNIVTTQLVRRGHPGNIIKCVDTGEMFASQNRAAQATGIHPFELYRHLAGQIDTAGGMRFVKLGEAA